jgi:hypothetical protein
MNKENSNYKGKKKKGKSIWINPVNLQAMS